jgi:hypothetical protein
MQRNTPRSMKIRAVPPRMVPTIRPVLVGWVDALEMLALVAMPMNGVAGVDVDVDVDGLDVGLMVEPDGLEIAELVISGR